MGRSHFSFGGERKVCKRKPAARRLREKALYCPFWRRGSLCRAQRNWTANIDVRARSELAFFRRQNGRAFFPPLPIAALLPRSWRRAGLPLAGEMISVAWLLCRAKNQAFCSPAVGGGHTCPLRGEWDSVAWPISVGWRPAGVGARAMRPVAEWRSALAKWQGAAPDRRAVAPVVPRR